MENSNLSTKSCVPCRSGIRPLEKEDTEKLLGNLGGNWQINDKGHLCKSFKFKDFMAAILFANKVAEIAEKQGHHPDLMISWGQCSVEIWTHKINGISENDFILAAKIEALT